MKKLRFVNDAAQKETRELPDDIKRNLGFELDTVQRGLEPNDFKPMPNVGKGVYELRIRNEQGQNIGRSFYVAKFGETIWVLHSFVKKAQQTPKENMEKGKKRYQKLLEILKNEK